MRQRRSRLRELNALRRQKTCKWKKRELIKWKKMRRRCNGESSRAVLVLWTLAAQTDEEVFLTCCSLISLRVFLTCCASSPLGHRTTGGSVTACLHVPSLRVFRHTVLWCSKLIFKHTFWFSLQSVCSSLQLAWGSSNKSRPVPQTTLPNTRRGGKTKSYKLHLLYYCYIQYWSLIDTQR